MSAPRRAPIIDYYAYRKDADLTCWTCGWHGPAGDAAEELYSELFDVACPECDTMLMIVNLPTADQMRTAAAAGSIAAQEALPWLQSVEQRRRRARKSALDRAEQLPEVAGRNLAFSWDLEERDDETWTLIRLGADVVWQELAYYEGWPRFNEVKDILKERYGERFASLTPTTASELYLFGDDGSAPGKISTT